MPEVNLAGLIPSIMGYGPVAAQGLAVSKALDFDKNKVNVNGGAIALGHPIGHHEQEY